MHWASSFIIAIVLVGQLGAAAHKKGRSWSSQRARPAEVANAAATEEYYYHKMATARLLWIEPGDHDDKYTCKLGEQSVCCVAIYTGGNLNGVGYKCECSL